MIEATYEALPYIGLILGFYLIGRALIRTIEKDHNR